MIDSIYIKNFKSIRAANLELGKLNLLFGMNGMGKSSTIQSLLLLRQSYWRSGKTNLDRLYPNGGLMDLGGASEVFNRRANDDSLEFIVVEMGKEQGASYSYKNQDQDLGVSFQREGNYCFDDFSGSLFSEGFVYLAAEHIGPKSKYGYSEWDVSGINKYGSHGEFSVPFLAYNGMTLHVSPNVCFSKEMSDLLMDQLTAWMGCISPGVRLNTELSVQEREARLKISYDEGNILSDDYSPTNVGFGIPYVLPVLTALLSAKEGDLVIIENPESHLHPKGQSALAKLMAKVAAGGVQIICESHSDHIINGVRVATKDGIIDCNDISIYYYSKNDQHETLCSKIRVDKFGNMDSYPEGLLDEWGNLMARLL